MLKLVRKVTLSKKLSLEGKRFLLAGTTICLTVLAMVATL